MRPASSTQPQGVAWFSVLSTMSTCYCAFESCDPRPYRKTAILLISSIGMGALSLLTMVQQTRHWPKENVRWLGGSFICFGHAWILTHQLGFVTMLKCHLWAIVACLAAGRVAYELLALLKERELLIAPSNQEAPAEEALEPFPEIDYSTLSTLANTVPAYVTQLGKCFHSAMAHAYRDLSPFSSMHGKVREFKSSELNAGPEGQLLAATTQLGIYNLFKQSYIVGDKIHFFNNYKGEAIIADLPISEMRHIKDSFFKFDLRAFHEKFFKISDRQNRLLTLKLTVAEESVIQKASADLSQAERDTVQELFKDIGSAKVTLEQKVMSQTSQDTANQINFTSIFTQT